MGWEFLVRLIKIKHLLISTALRTGSLLGRHSSLAHDGSFFQIKRRFFLLLTLTMLLSAIACIYTFSFEDTIFPQTWLHNVLNQTRFDKGNMFSDVRSVKNPLAPLPNQQVQPRGTTPQTTDIPIYHHVAHPRNYHFIMDEPDKCKENPFLVFMVPVAPHQVDARNAIRSTWGNESTVQGKTILTLFLVGLTERQKTQEDVKEESRQHRDLIQSNFMDSYFNLTIKTMVIMDWLATRCPQANYSMKVDSDMFINVNNLITLLLRPDTPRENYITGMLMWNRPVVRNKDSKWYVSEELYPEPTYPTYLLGMGYVFSNDLPARLVEVSKVTKPFNIEDAYIGACLKHLGVSPSSPPDPSQFRAYLGQYVREDFLHVITTILGSPQRLRDIWTDITKPVGGRALGVSSPAPQDQTFASSTINSKLFERHFRCIQPQQLSMVTFKGFYRSSLAHDGSFFQIKRRFFLLLPLTILLSAIACIYTFSFEDTIFPQTWLHNVLNQTSFDKGNRFSDVRSVKNPLAPLPNQQVQPRGTTPQTTDIPIYHHVAHPRNYHFIMDEPDKCKENPFLVFMVPVAPHQVDARNAIRSTWGNESTVQGKTILTLFLVGLTERQKTQEDVKEESRQHRDLIQSNFIDSYFNLTIKTMVIMDWLATRCPQANYSMKVDSDMFINVNNLITLLLRPDTPRENYITGNMQWERPVVRDIDSKWYVSEELYPESTYPPYPVGMGYVFSNDLPAKLVEVSKVTKPFNIEDAYIGACLKHLGVSLSSPPDPFLFRDFFEDYVREDFLWVITTILDSPQQLIEIWTDVKQP
ncbi:hypothetical protein DNTS_006568, partial [Danionella cerebrum]